MSFIKFEDIGKSYDGETFVLRNLNLEIEKGELVTLLGSSGSGKSTLLRMLAGFEEITEGKIYIDGKDVSNLAPGERDLGMVFQQYSLFPNMTVYENVAFGPKMNKLPDNEINKKVREMIKIVDLEGREDYYPNNLSGGQKQRVALARALVNEPSVLLLDEPLSAIDALLRKNLQDAIRNVQRELGITTIFVTHDQDEAMILSDVVHIMNQGEIEQSGTPTEIYVKPETEFVARFIGNYNVMSSDEFSAFANGHARDSSIAIRPEVMSLTKEKPEETQGNIVLEGKIKDYRVSGNILSYLVEVNDATIRVDELYRSFKLFEVGERVYVDLPAHNVLTLV